MRVPPETTASKCAQARTPAAGHFQRTCIAPATLFVRCRRAPPNFTQILTLFAMPWKYISFLEAGRLSRNGEATAQNAHKSYYGKFRTARRACSASDAKPAADVGLRRRAGTLPRLWARSRRMRRRFARGYGVFSAAGGSAGFKTRTRPTASNQHRQPGPATRRLHLWRQRRHGTRRQGRGANWRRDGLSGGACGHGFRSQYPSPGLDRA